MTTLAEHQAAVRDRVRELDLRSVLGALRCCVNDATTAAQAAGCLCDDILDQVERRGADRRDPQYRLELLRWGQVEALLELAKHCLTSFDPPAEEPES